MAIATVVLKVSNVGLWLLELGIPALKIRFDVTAFFPICCWLLVAFLPFTGR